MDERTQRRNGNNGELVIDNVLTTQSELGPSIPDGGYGWLVFAITLVFQAIIPSLLISFGIFLAFDRMQRNTLLGKNPKLWDNSLLHVPLFFMASWTFFDSTIRYFISQSKWPKLFGSAGTCLTCAGLLFVWMGMTGPGQSWLFISAGVILGIGGSIQIAQCEILLAQYFRLKLPVLTHICHAMSAVGFMVAPIILGHQIFSSSLMKVILWYQAIILQGLVLNLFLRKPMYLKSKKIKRYNYISANPDDEEDIFSKNSRELQIKSQTSNGLQIETHEIPSVNNNNNVGSKPGSSNDAVPYESKTKFPNTWVTFDEEEEEEEIPKYERVTQLETFEDKRQNFVEEGNDHLKENSEVEKIDRKNWETFEDDPNENTRTRNDSATRNNRNLRLEMSFGVEETTETPATRSVNGLPIPLFADTPVNNNVTYSYDILEDPFHRSQSTVFTTQASVNPVSYFTRTSLEVLQEPTFYKTLLTIITTKWSLFVFFSMFPSFLYQEVVDIKMKQLSNLIGAISLSTFFFSAASYWLSVEKKWRPKILILLTWIGALGYLMIADYFTEGVLLFGAVLIALSLAALQHVGAPLLGLTVKGEPTREYNLICILTGSSFLIFPVLNIAFKDVFRIMALMNFVTGFVWLGNYIYKRLRIR